MNRTNFLHFSGYCIIPGCLFLPLLIMPSVMDNYSGFLAAYPAAGRLFGFLILGWIYFLLQPHQKRPERVLTAILFLMSVLIPYRESTLYADIHLAASYASFLLITVYWLRIHRTDLKKLQFFGGLMGFCALLCFTASSVCGPAEFLYMSYMSISLTAARP
ncbi:MAG: hypothetical protein IKG46_09225 [Solobacterium sp.]|nr:hypothetical protein [Solobacterium sp.]